MAAFEKRGTVGFSQLVLPDSAVMLGIDSNEDDQEACLPPPPQKKSLYENSITSKTEVEYIYIYF